MTHPHLTILALTGILLPPGPAAPQPPSSAHGMASLSPPASGMADRRSAREARDARRTLRDLQSQEKRLRTSRVAFDLDRECEVEELIERLERAAPPDSEFSEDLNATLLSLLGTALDQADRKPQDLDRWARLAALTEAPLAERLGPPGLARLREGVLAPATGGSAPQRAAVARLLAADRSPRTTMALLATSRASSDLLANACLDSLVGRREEAVHALLVRELIPLGETPLVDPRKLARAELHFSFVPLAEDSPAAATLALWVSERITSQSWREACRAVALSRTLADEAIVPALIEALGLWRGREDSGVPVRRTLHEIASELKDRSGRNIGTDPRRWQVWWRGVQNGTVTRRAGGAQSAETTVAGFFGIRPASDRIVFIIDASGSMDAAFLGGTGTGTINHTRYKEAVQQLEGCLKLLGPKTEFDVVLFNSGSAIWKNRLVPATHSYIQGAKAWLRAHSPGGGTGLRGGVQKALHMKRWGNLDLDALEADTVVILCDGGTNSGPGWVGPFLREVNSEARLLFHTVRIGGAGDGTLEALALGTGGRCVDVDG